MAQITVVGGINIDIEGCPFNKLKYQDSNPGKISLAYGGVGRNITENIARLGGDAAMVSVIGDDQMGLGAKQHLQNLGVDTSCISVIEGRNTAMYLSILDENNDMELALCDMDIIEALTPEILEKHKDFIRQSQIVALDGNLSEEQLVYVLDMLEGIPVFFDPVSAAKAVKAKAHIGKFHSIKPNVMEAEILCGMKICSDSDVRRAGRWFVENGVKRVFITLNRDGVYYCDSESDGFIRPAGNLRIVSATGAGDSFSATIMLGHVMGRSCKETAGMGMAAASLTMESESAVSDKMLITEIERRMKEYV